MKIETGRRFFELALLFGIFIALFIILPRVSAGNFYIRAGATGAGTGANWADAWPSFSAVTWARGNTYYVAGGDYTQLLASGVVSDDGTTTTLIDRNTNFANLGLTVGAADGVFAANTAKQTVKRIISISTTYNPNDTLNFTSAFTVANLAGDTYALYKQITIPSLSGTSWITIKKANEADNGNDPGWNPSYATTQAVITGRVYIASGYVRIDGVTGSGTTGHGIKIKCPFDYVVLQISNAVSTPYELLHLDVEGPGFDYGRTGQDGIYHNGQSSSTRGVHISNCWIHEIPRNGLTLGALAGTSYEDYGLLFEDNVLERIGGVGMRYPLIHGQAMQFYMQPLQYSIFRNNIFRNVNSQAHISLLGGVTADHLRIYNNVFYSNNGDCTVYGIADSGSATSITQLYRSFNSYESPVGRVLTNINKGATGIITSVGSVGTPIGISGGMSGGVVNEAGDVFSFPTTCRSAYLLAATIYSSAGNPITNAEVYSNTFYNQRLAQISFVTPSDETGSIAKNNLWVNSWFTTISYTPPSLNTGYYNCTEGPYKPVNTESSDPFINSAGYNFHLKPTASAVGTGEDLSSVFTTDKDGTLRPQGSGWDIGAFEYSSGTQIVVDGWCGVTVNTCAAGTLNDLVDNSINYIWQCLGQNGGTSALCSLLIPASPAVCGNGIQEAGEECDLTNISVSCVSRGYVFGNISCTAGCTLNLSLCVVGQNSSNSSNDGSNSGNAGSSSSSSSGGSSGGSRESESTIVNQETDSRILNGNAGNNNSVTTLVDKVKDAFSFDDASKINGTQEEKFEKTKELFSIRYVILTGAVIVILFLWIFKIILRHRKKMAGEERNVGEEDGGNLIS